MLFYYNIVHNVFPIFGEKSFHPLYNRGLPTIYRYKFSINTTSPFENYEIVSSELLLLQKVSPKGRRYFTSIETLQVSFVYKEMDKYSSIATKKEIIETKVVDVDERYVTFDVTNAVKRWMEVNVVDSGEITFEVEIKPPELISNHRPLQPILEFDILDKKTTKFVLKYGSSENLSTLRKKRQLDVMKLDREFCFANPAEPNCCVKSLEIDLAEDLDYTFVVMPKRYNSNFCIGLCPAFWPTASNSTSLLRSYKELNPTFAPKPCCAPDEFGSLSMMVSLSPNQFEILKLPNMVVKSCICR